MNIENLSACYTYLWDGIKAHKWIINRLKHVHIVLYFIWFFQCLDARSKIFRQGFRNLRLMLFRPRQVWILLTWFFRLNRNPWLWSTHLLGSEKNRFFIKHFFTKITQCVKIPQKIALIVNETFWVVFTQCESFYEARTLP